MQRSHAERRLSYWVQFETAKEAPSAHHLSPPSTAAEPSRLKRRRPYQQREAPSHPSSKAQEVKEQVVVLYISNMQQPAAIACIDASIKRCCCAVHQSAVLLFYSSRGEESGWLSSPSSLAHPPETHRQGARRSSTSLYVRLSDCFLIPACAV